MKAKVIRCEAYELQDELSDWLEANPDASIVSVTQSESYREWEDRNGYAESNTIVTPTIFYTA